MRRLTHNTFILFILAACSFTFGAQANVLIIKYEDLPDLLQRNNGDLKAAQSLVESNEARTGHLFRSYLPRLELQGGMESFQTGPYSTMTQPYGSVEARWNFFRGGRDFLEDNRREELHAASQFERVDVQNNALARGRKLFWQLMYLREVESYIQEALVLNTKNLEAANKRIRAGLVTDTDRLEFEISEVRYKRDLNTANTEIANTARELVALLKLPPETEVRTEQSIIPHQHDDPLLSETPDLSLHRQVLSLQSQHLALDYEKRQAWRWWTPSVEAYAGYLLFTFRERDYFRRADRLESVVGVRLSFNLFDGLESYSNSRASSALADAYQYQAQQRISELNANYENSRRNLQLAHSQIHLAEENIKQGEKYLKNTLSEYSRGVKNSPDVLQAIQRYIEFKIQAADLRRDYQISRTDLLNLISK